MARYCTFQPELNTRWWRWLPNGDHNLVPRALVRLSSLTKAGLPSHGRCSLHLGSTSGIGRYDRALLWCQLPFSTFFCSSSSLGYIAVSHQKNDPKARHEGGFLQWTNLMD